MLSPPLLTQILMDLRAWILLRDARSPGSITAGQDRCESTCISDAGKLDLASCRGFECSFWGRDRGRKRGREDRKGENLSSACFWYWGAWGESRGCEQRRSQGKTAALPGDPFLIWWQRHNILGPMHRSQLELCVLFLHLIDLRASLCVALFFHSVFFSNNPLQGYRDIICQASQQSSFLPWDYIREHRLYYHFRSY